MKNILITSLFALLLMGCKKETPTQNDPVTAEPKMAPAPKSECYAYNENGSAISVQLNYDGNSVSGNLSYALKEKDRNTGTLEGKIENNILVADYKFASEGTQSTRQVAFKLENNQLIEGYGEMNQDGTKFKDVSKLDFDSKMPLAKTDCNK